MASMSSAVDPHRELAGWGRRVAAQLGNPVVVSAVLGVTAIAETIARAAPTLHTVTGTFLRASHTTANAQSLVLSLFTLSVLALATTIPLAVLRPIMAAIIICLASVVSLAVFSTFTVAGLAAQLIALYRLGRLGPSGSAAQFIAPGLAAPFLVLALVGPTDTEPGVLTVLLAVLGPVAAWAGTAARARAEEHLHNAARQVMAETLVEHAARGERARIARELHDVVAHHVSMIVVQAETARLTTTDLPAAGAQRLAEISASGRSALTEMRRLLGVLRQDAAADSAERHPQPRLQQLVELLDGARDVSHSAIRLIVSGSPVAIEPGAELAAYRIVQEALTNARRHAPGAAVDVELRYTEDALHLRIRDNGPGLRDDAPPGGHGLNGMRERAAAVDGELRIGAARGGGLLIEATLPAKA